MELPQLSRGCYGAKRPYYSPDNVLMQASASFSGPWVGIRSRRELMRTKERREMPRISTFLTAITLSLALGLLAVPGNAQAGHKSDGHGKGGGYERHASGHHKVKRDHDWDDRRGSHGYRKFDRDDDDRGYKHGHKKRHKKHHKQAHKKHHKKHQKHAHKKHHKHGHGHGHAKHHRAKRHGHNDLRVQGFLGQLQAGLYGNAGGCHKVSKIGYRNRQKALIGGTACYDRYGNLYIVEGSRYVIRYLNDEWH